MKTILLFPLLAFSVGALIPVQAAANSMLSLGLRSVTYAAMALFTTGLLFILFVALVFRVEPPSMTVFASVPGYSFIGGVIVATYVLAITFLTPQMGVGSAICWIVTGQIVTAVVIDHFGLIGASEHYLNWQRATGVFCMIGGTFLARG